MENKPNPPKQNKPVTINYEIDETCEPSTLASIYSLRKVTLIEMAFRTWTKEIQSSQAIGF
jgi:hypothetical protein